MADNFKPCSVAACNENAHQGANGRRGRCQKHYRQWVNAKPERPKCSIPDCGKPVRGHGFCNAHWLRLRRHGDPLAGATSPGEPERYLREVVLKYEGDECLTWPYARASNGYGYISSGLVSRAICDEVHGPAPTSKHEAAHSCGNGHLGCATKGHLSWKTPVENAADRLLHGTHVQGETHGMADLTESEVRLIRKLVAGGATQEVVANLFEISQSNVSAIHLRKRWGWLPD